MFVLQTVFFKQLKQIFISKEKKEFKTISDLLVFVFQKEKKSVSSLCLALSSNNFLSVSKLAEIHLTTQPRHITADGFPSGLEPLLRLFSSSPHSCAVRTSDASAPLWPALNKVTTGGWKAIRNQMANTRHSLSGARRAMWNMHSWSNTEIWLRLSKTAQRST